MKLRVFQTIDVGDKGLEKKETGAETGQDRHERLLDTSYARKMDEKRSVRQVKDETHEVYETQEITGTMQVCSIEEVDGEVSSLNVNAGGKEDEGCQKIVSALETNSRRTDY